MAKPKNKVYLVEVGAGRFRRFHNWPECQAFVHGTSMAFAGGLTEAEAKHKLLAGKEKRKFVRSVKKQSSSTEPRRAASYPTVGLTSDAGTHGNPGPCEYQVTDIRGRRLAHRELGVHSNNYAELAGIGAMIQCALRLGERVLWTDSQIAIIWIRSGKIGENVREPEAVKGLIEDIRELLRQNPHLELKKWDTKSWGQIPSDFGRK